MAIIIDMPKPIEDRLRADFGDLDAAAKEAMAIEFYRQGRVSHGDLGQLLGKSRYEIDGLLKQYHVTEDLITSEEHSRQLAGLRKIVGE